MNTYGNGDEMNEEPNEAGGEEAKRVALDLILDAWDAGLQEGIDPEVLATTAIFAALTDMVDIYGAEPVAKMAETLPSRIRDGEFSLSDEGEA